MVMRAREPWSQVHPSQTCRPAGEKQTGASSENYSLIAFAARHALAVKVFEQGDGVLAGKAREFFKVRHSQAVVLCFAARQNLAKLRATPIDGRSGPR